MKKNKLLLTSLLLISFFFCTAQEKTDLKQGTVTGVATGGLDQRNKERAQQQRALEELNRKQNSGGKNSGGGWQTDGCYKGISYKVENYGYKKDWKGAGWGVVVKNNYKIPVQIDYKLEVGGLLQAGGHSLTYFLAPGESYTNDAGLLLALLFDTKSTSYIFQVISLCFNKEDGCYKSGYAECDNGTPNQPNGNSKSNTNSNSNSNSNGNSNSTPYDVTDLQAAIDKVNSLCGKLNMARSNAVSLSNKYCSKTWQRTDAELQEAKRAITALEKEIDDQGSAEKAAQKAADEQAERERKAAEEKNNRYQTYMSDGESALSNEKYDEALQNFQNAVNEASNDGQLNAARNAYAKAQTAKEAAFRKVRVEEKQAVEKKQNDVTTAAIGGFAGVMALVKDNYSNGKFAAKFQIGLGYGNTPLIVNSVKQFKTTIKDNNQILFHMGFNLTVFNNKGINFELKPSIGIGLSSFQKGTDGGGEEYGGTGILWLAPKAKSNFKLFAEGGYFFRNGTYNYDQDVALGPTSATDNVEKGEFKYKVLRYGGGFKISFVNDEYLESYIKPAMFLEMPSFFTKTTKPTMVFNVQAYILSNALIDFSYSKNYYIPGKIDYFGSFTKENKNYFSIKIIRQGKLK